MKFSKRFKKSTLEAGILTALFLDLLWWHSGFLFWLTALYFFFGYVLYRREALLNFKHSEPIRSKMTLADISAIEEEYTRRDDFNTFEKRAMVRSPLDRYYYLGRYRRVQDLLDRYGAGAGRILDMGCGFGIHTMYAFRQLRIPAVGLELNRMKLTEAVRAFRLDEKPRNLNWVCGEAERPPFRPASFDCILFTEVLEHLLDPSAGLAACRYLLGEGGLLILTTPSSHNLNYSNNPFIIAEKVLSLYWDRILPPYHNLHAQFEFNWKKPEPAYGVHYHFSQRRLAFLLQQNRFETVWWGSYEIEAFPFLLLELLAQGNVKTIAKFADRLEMLSEKLPLIGHLGQHLLWIAQKRTG
ncbi:MAG: class I SAM-dependent methyltransferase [Desulforhabdus sp.]|jgi:2-polyprenyl-3-methyl-5-hydroxy-6-metoxy-1,4-benzoquinol methylase|nr:class I SAM-dependent methyltransferase [Desulforhabdus sp.]